LNGLGADRRQHGDWGPQRKRNEPFAALDADIRCFLDSPARDDDAWYRRPALALWQQARAALMDDADAPLPEI
jgi:hypothetical protein